jgi:hypothetical protein
MKRLILIAVLAASACADTTYDYDPATAGDSEGGDRAPRAKTSSQFLRGIYADLVGRTPESYDFVISVNGQPQARIPLDEETLLGNVLEGLGDSLPMRNLLVKGLLHSAEVTVPEKAEIADAREYIREQFRRFLGREPNAYELGAFADEWANDPAVGPRTIIRAITGSREYQSQ